MRVIHLTVTIDRGGSENHLISLIEEQVKNNYEVLVVYLKGKPYWEEHLNKLGVQTQKISLFSSYFQLSKIISFYRPDVLHSHLQSSEIISRLSLLLHPKLKFIISKHNDEDSRFLPVFIQKYFYKFISSRASKIIAISQNVKNFCTDRLNINRDKIEVIFYGIDSSMYNPENLNKDDIEALKSELDIGNSDFVVGTIARLHPQKSLDTLIKAINIIVKEKNISNIKCIIVGEGELEKQLKEQVDNLQLTDYIKFTGKRNDIPNVLQIFDVFILCSIYEGLGLVLLEAMSAKVPIIGTRAGAIPEIIGDTGIIIDIKDSTTLANKILYIKENDDEMQEMVEKAHNKIIRQFSLESMFLKTEKVYI